MRVFAYDRFKPGVTMETITPRLPEEVANVWRLWKAGIVRENYARADEPGVAKAGFLEWIFVPLMAPLPLESLFRADVDVDEPYDRTARTAVAR
jgi:hypothetical protein